MIVDHHLRQLSGKLTKSVRQSRYCTYISKYSVVLKCKAFEGAWCNLCRKSGSVYKYLLLREEHDVTDSCWGKRQRPDFQCRVSSNAFLMNNWSSFQPGILVHLFYRYLPASIGIYRYLSVSYHRRP